MPNLEFSTQEIIRWRDDQKALTSDEQHYIVTRLSYLLMEHEANIEGFNAYHNDIEVDQNPYPVYQDETLEVYSDNDIRHYAWNIGWEQAYEAKKLIVASMATIKEKWQ